jgi:4-amino-4-deoxy-L-arabinose transferase-like glycosyltransferase
MSSSQTQPNRAGFFLLALIAIALYLPAVFLVELQGGEEAGYAAVAREMIRAGNWLQPRLQGNPANIFPLYSWLIALFSFGSAPTLLSIRLPALLSVWGMAVLAGMTARKSKGDLAGFMAAVVVLTCWASLRIGIRAQGETLHAFLLSLAWFSWYRFGPQEQRWHLAWGSALLFVFLDVLTVGIKGLILFYLPLLLIRNPPKIMRQLQSAPHVLMLAIFAVITLVWIQVVCPQPFLTWNAIAFSRPMLAKNGFFGHLFAYPAKVFLYLLPWGLMAWAPFCLAMRQFEPTGSRCSFLRTLVFVPFVLFLLWPSISPLQLFPALPPMAVLLGIHFEIVINWYRRFFLSVTRLAYALIALGACLLTMFWMLLFLGNLELRPNLLSHAATSALALALCLLGALFTWGSIQQFKRVRKTPLWQSMLLCVLGLRLLMLAGIFIPFLTIGDRKLHGLALAGKAPPGALASDSLSSRRSSSPFAMKGEDAVKTVYLHGNYAYLVEVFYLDKEIVRLNAFPGGLPTDEPVVYLLSHRQPPLPSRHWEPVSPSVDMAQKRRLLFEPPSSSNQYRGIIARRPVPRDQHIVAGGIGTDDIRRHHLCLYRGVLKTE